MRRSVALEWNVRGARVTLFHDSKPIEKSLWQLMQGAPAETIAKRGNCVEESGSVDGQRVTLLAQANRIDLLLAPATSNVSPDTPQLSRVTCEAIVPRIAPLLSKL